LFVGSKELVEKLLEDQALIANKRAKEGLQEMKLLFTYLEAFSILDKVLFFFFLYFLKL